MKSKKMFQVLAMAVALIFIGAAGVMAASVDPVVIDDWESGDAYSECEQAGGCGDYAYKVEPWDEGDPSGPYEADGGNTITITAYEDEGEYKSFDWSSEFPVCAVIVKAGTGALIYYYPDGAYSDTNLVAYQGKGVSHATFCYNEPDICYEEETAWAVGQRYVNKGNWAMYVPYDGKELTVDIRAGGGDGVGIIIGTATFSAPAGDSVTININLTGEAIFYYDVNDPYYDNNLKVQDYEDTPPNKNPAPGKFDWKENVEVGETTKSIVVPLNNYYGVHLDVAVPVPCE